MYKSSFVSLVKEAYDKSQKFYKENNHAHVPNPYYVGYGNPNADVLFIGKEKGFSISDEVVPADTITQLRLESIWNPNEWHDYVKNNRSFYTDKKYDSKKYLNAFYPFEKPAATWKNYHKLLRLIDSKVGSEPVALFRNAFLTEINHKPSKTSVITSYSKGLNHDRFEFLKHPFYKNFKVTVLACGGYLKRDAIEELFGVSFVKNCSETNHKLVVYKAYKRVFIHTRQLSNAFRAELLGKISDIVKPYV